MLQSLFSVQLASKDTFKSAGSLVDKKPQKLKLCGAARLPGQKTTAVNTVFSFSNQHQLQCFTDATKKQQHPPPQ